jgi:hypothetical protein
MAYKKYIEKDGKIYGPYIYHSRRVDGKVVSEYYGSKKINYKKFLIIFLCFIFALVLIYTFIKLPGNFTGKAVLSVEQEKDQPASIIKLSLKQGELIPATSKIIFESDGDNYEYPVNGLLSDEPISGNYYVQGANLTGDGLGYGNPGMKKIYPEVSFALEVYNEVKTKIPEEKNETVNQNISENNLVNETTEENTTENSVNLSETEIVQEEKISDNTSETENPVQEINSEETEISAEISAETVEETQANEIPTETAPEEKTPEQASEISGTESTDEETSSAITGNVVKGIFSRVYNFFLGLSPTGKVTEELGKEITGNVSGTNDFVYELGDGQSARLVSGSVNINGEKLPDNTIDVKIIQGKAVVMTDYSEEEKGFGSDYLGNDEKEFTIALSQLNLNFSGKELKIKLVNDNEEILSTDSSPDKIQETEENISEIKIINETLEIPNVLTNSELSILADKFGNNFSVKTTRAEIFNGRMLVRNVLGDYWIEYSYDYNSELTDDLKAKIENDKIKWLKEIARTFSEPEPESQEVSELITEKNYNNINVEQENSTE